MQLNWGAVGKRVGKAIQAGTDEGNAGKSDSSDIGRKVGSGLRKGIKYGIGKMKGSKPKSGARKVISV